MGTVPPLRGVWGIPLVVAIVSGVFHRVFRPTWYARMQYDPSCGREPLYPPLPGWILCFLMLPANARMFLEELG